MTIELNNRLYWKLCSRLDQELRVAENSLDLHTSLDADRDDDLYKEEIKKDEEEVAFLSAVLIALEGCEDG